MTREWTTKSSAFVLLCPQPRSRVQCLYVVVVLVVLVQQQQACKAASTLGSFAGSDVQQFETLVRAGHATPWTPEKAKNGTV